MDDTLRRRRDDYRALRRRRDDYRALRRWRDDYRALRWLCDNYRALRRVCDNDRALRRRRDDYRALRRRRDDHGTFRPRLRQARADDSTYHSRSNGQSHRIAITMVAAVMSTLEMMVTHLRTFGSGGLSVPWWNKNAVPRLRLGCSSFGRKWSRT